MWRALVPPLLLASNHHGQVKRRRRSLAGVGEETVSIQPLGPIESKRDRAFR